MASKATQRKSDLTPWMLVLIGALGLGALVAYVKGVPADRVPVDLSRDPAASSRSDTVDAYKPHYEQGNLKFTKRSVEVPEGHDPIVYSVNEYLKESTVTPEGASLVSAKVNDGIADLDFNAAFRTTYGTEDEQTILNGILTVLGQFHDIVSARFLVEGKPLDTLGNVDLSEPQLVIRNPSTPSEKP
ncbi:MAG: hypothetical protein HONBIEJF_00590 [Fimbriimonadaceae bacterium]|nr:hypothetical protein [Fimbriimonadaceae bacterium]